MAHFVCEVLVTAPCVSIMRFLSEFVSGFTAFCPPRAMLFHTTFWSSPGELRGALVCSALSAEGFVSGYLGVRTARWGTLGCSGSWPGGGRCLQPTPGLLPEGFSRRRLSLRRARWHQRRGSGNVPFFQREGGFQAAWRPAELGERSASILHPSVARQALQRRPCLRAVCLRLRLGKSSEIRLWKRRCRVVLVPFQEAIRTWKGRSV